jgi:hypothetical protein
MENKVTAAEQEASEKVEAKIEASKADAKARQEEFKAPVTKEKEAVASQWEELRASHNQRVEQIKSNIEAKKEARELKRAMRRADDAESYAEASVYWALIAIDEAEIATLEAIGARAYADSLA